MKKKEDFIFLAVLLGLILIFIVFKVVKGRKAEAPELDTTSLTSLSTDQTAPPKLVVIKKKKIPSILPELSYTDEFMRYRDGHLIQFNNECAAFPFSTALANGSGIMLDNRSNKEQLITFGDSKYTLKPYDFETLIIKAPAIPTTYQVDCNERQNVATLIVE